jgi:hypothetical protein
MNLNPYQNENVSEIQSRAGTMLCVGPKQNGFLTWNPLMSISSLDPERCLFGKTCCFSQHQRTVSVWEPSDKGRNESRIGVKLKKTIPCQSTRRKRDGSIRKTTGLQKVPFSGGKSHFSARKRWTKRRAVLLRNDFQPISRENDRPPSPDGILSVFVAII